LLLPVEDGAWVSRGEQERVAKEAPLMFGGGAKVHTTLPDDRMLWLPKREFPLLCMGTARIFS
jgi:hypothetical protein